MWERPGTLLLAEPTIAVISRVARVVFVDPESGENIRRIKKRDSDVIVGGDSAVARLRKGALTVFTASEDPARILKDLPSGTRLLGIEDGRHKSYGSLNQDVLTPLSSLI